MVKRLCNQAITMSVVMPILRSTWSAADRVASLVGISGGLRSPVASYALLIYFSSLPYVFAKGNLG